MVSLSQVRQEVKESWNSIYQDNSIAKLPWYSKALDKDLSIELKRLKKLKGSFLDIGSGPGTQAGAIAKRGFSVTGMDLSQAAVSYAKKHNPDVSFVQGDILNPQLRAQFDFILDRGCFHTLAPRDRKLYAENVSRLLNENGILFLKCFSKKETQFQGGPFRFTPAAIGRIFNRHFKVEKIKEARFQGKLKPAPRALFAVLKKRGSAQ